MHNFVYLAQRRSQEFSCEPNFGGACPSDPPDCATANNCPFNVHAFSAVYICRLNRGISADVCSTSETDHRAHTTCSRVDPPAAAIYASHGTTCRDYMRTVEQSSEVNCSASWMRSLATPAAAAGRYSHSIDSSSSNSSPCSSAGNNDLR